MTRLRSTAAAATTLGRGGGFSLLAPALAAEPDASPPTGAVGGLRSPASGTLQLLLYASDKGSGLASAVASLDGSPASSATLSGASVSAVPLPIDTSSVPDGPHQLTVRVTDAAGNTATLLDRQIAVRNTPPLTGKVASVTVGVATKEDPGGNGKGGGKGKGKGPCHHPKLKMRLLAKPLWRTRPGRLPVLRFRRPHPYRGHLTCLIDGRRVSAPEGTAVQVFYRIWKRSFRKRRGPIQVKKGQIRVKGGAFARALAS